MAKKMAIESRPRYILLGSRKGLLKRPLPPRFSVCRNRSEVESEVRRPAKGALWISFNRNSTDMLLKNWLAVRSQMRGAHLITLTPPRSESIAALQGLFHPVFGLVEGFQWLPEEELVDVIAKDDAATRFIGGCADQVAKALTLVRGDMAAVIAPFAMFQPSGDGTAPDFSKLRLTDYGRTIALGDYEAAADAILYELDPDFRRVLKQRRRQNERTFGAALTRLRKQRGLRRSDFAPISSKEIARLERNEVENPHAKTLEILGTRLGVPAEEIESY
jgi:hypothetical protein